MGIDGVCRVGINRVNGSPPRVWGRLPGSHRGHGRNRVTPTHVGTTLRAAPYSPSDPVHPHACGDDLPPRRRQRGGNSVPPHACGDDGGCIGVAFLLSVPPPRMWGRRLRSATARFAPSSSPPRMWGRRSGDHLADRGTRFTPTHVGTTPTRRRKSSRRAVHPHACGDDLCQGRRFSAT